MKVIEITGLPKAGKTTLVNRLAVRLRNQGFRVKKISDPSAKSPIDSDNIWFNQTWIVHKIIDKLMDVRNMKYDVVLVHCGLAERIITAQTFYKLKLLVLKQVKLLTNYLKSFIGLEDLVLYLDIKPKTSLKRNKGRRGRLINEKFLTLMRRIYKKQFPRYVNKYFELNAEEDIKSVVEQAENIILTLLKK